jgi:calcium binding protein 39
MSFLFKPKPKSPSELVKATRDAIVRLDSGVVESKKGFGATFKKSDGEKQTVEDISKNLLAMKNILYGDGGIICIDLENEPVPELLTQLATELVNADLLVLLVQSFHSFEFEAKKDVAQIFNNLLRRQLGTRFPTADYIASKPEILMTLMAGYN